MNNNEFERHGAAISRELLSQRLKVRKLQEDEESMLGRTLYEYLEQRITHLQKGIEESLLISDWVPFVDALAEIGIELRSRQEEEDFITTWARARLEKENPS